MNARVTLVGFERELNALNKSITDTWDLSNENYNKDDFLAAIIMKGGRFEPLYADPEYFYLMCGFWWNKWKKNFGAWFDALDLEYNPIENWDKYESWHQDIDDVGTDDTSTTNRTVVDEDLSHNNRIEDSKLCTMRLRVIQSLTVRNSYPVRIKSITTMIRISRMSIRLVLLIVLIRHTYLMI